MKAKVVKRGRPKGTELVKKESELPEKAAEGVKAIAGVDPMSLLAQAIDKNLPIESMERLLAMRKEMKQEFARDQFFTALSGFQRECPTVEKRHQVRDKDKVTKADKGLRYSYAPLEDIVDAVKPFLDKWGFSWTIKPKQTREDVTVSCYAHHKDGHEEVTEFTVPIDPDAYMSDPQKAAAALTFARRYAFINAFGIVTKGEDNDAQRSEEPRRREPIKAPQEQAVPVQHEVKDTGPYATIIRSLGATENSGKMVVSIFTANEQTDYRNQADMAKGNQAELDVILKDIIAVGSQRRRAIKGSD
jgi:hypothetical protein